MDIRNVQKTGKMFYVYLPTSWCKKHEISSDSKVSLEQTSKGSITISPSLVQKKPKSIEITIDEDNIEILQRLIMACYINPANSFRIKLKTEMDVAKLLQQKKLISIELVEMDKKSIICESNLSIENPQSLLRTMVRKSKNLLLLMIKDYDKELVERYEEEIDRSKILIEKSVISGLTYAKITDLKMIELHYISLIAKNLERCVDHLITLRMEDSKFLETLIVPFDSLKGIIENMESLNYTSVVEFIKKVMAIPEVQIKDLKSYDKYRIKHYMIDISEVLLDWAITKEIGE